jgi:hypothetical protein
MQWHRDIILAKGQKLLLPTCGYTTGLVGSVGLLLFDRFVPIRQRDQPPS